MIFQPEFECINAAELKTLQTQRLRHTVAYTYDNVPAFAAKMDAAGVKPRDVVSLKDIERLPFTQKSDMRAAFPYGLFAVPMEQVVRLHASSGTTGSATVVGYTKNDLDMWSTCVARIAMAGGAGPGDIAQIAFGYGMFTGALGLHYGLEKIGAAVAPVSAGNTERQIQLMRDFGSTLLVATPSYALYMYEAAAKLDALGDIKLKYGLFGGEGSTEEMRAAIEKNWGIQATENYGLSEILGPGVSGECLEKTGLHICEDHFYCEIINPDTGEVLPDGEWGELVITTLTREACPMVRYRTRDITCLVREPCACGRTSMRMLKVRGRSDDMLIIRGVNVFPSQIESVLLATPEVGAHYEIILRREHHMDTVEVRVELADASLLEKFSSLEKLAADIRARIKAGVLCDTKVTLVNPQTLKRYEGKARRVTDLRNEVES